ncbi:MAG: hypothetical protein K1X89_29020, partial [Myxococcaceae bacterium]|nr:hypothetical protein [Myxococcaceae bacterium]
MRGWVTAVVLWAGNALAHVVPFDFVAPSGVGQATQGGKTTLQWVDGMDPQGLAAFQLFASRGGLPPDAPPARDLTLSDAGLPVNEPSNVFEWVTSGLAPGCAQPFAVMQDTIEGETVRPSRGVLRIRPEDGGNEPPALWVVTPPDEPPAADGTLQVRVKVVDPDDVGAVTLSWTRGDAGGFLAGPLPVPDGGGLLSYPLRRGELPPGAAFLRAEVVGFDGQRCAVWWPGVLQGPDDAGPA